MATRPPRPMATKEEKGVKFGKYMKFGVVGKGSFAEVYRGTHTDGSLIAIKSVHVSKLQGKLKLSLFSEIDILKSITHPHVVGLIDCLESQNHVHLIMEYCQLGDMALFVRKRNHLDNHELMQETIRRYPCRRGAGFNEVIVRHYVQQTCSALAYLRKMDYMHRDLKPGNLLLQPPPAWMAMQPVHLQSYQVAEHSDISLAGLDMLPTLKIADFGFARHLPKSTMAETLCGSPLYMAPEILNYEKYQANADLWSLGTVVYELVAGRPPFKAKNHVELLRMIEAANDHIEFPSNCDMSDELRFMILGLLKRQPTDRMTYEELFDLPLVKGDIPNLHPYDAKRQAARSKPKSKAVMPIVEHVDPLKGDSFWSDSTNEESRQDLDSYSTPPAARRDFRPTPAPAATTRAVEQPRRSSNVQRPALATHVTAPAAQALQIDPVRTQHRPEKRLSMGANTAAAAESSPRQAVLAENLARRKAETAAKEARERTAQDIAFERDYVLIEKGYVEVNAFADELAASPHVRGGAKYSATAPAPGGLMRRATTQGRPTSLTGAQEEHAKDMQVAVRPEQYQTRRQSWDFRAVQPRISAASAISKALNMVQEKAPFLYDYFGGQLPSMPQSYSAYPQTLYALPTAINEPYTHYNSTEEESLRETILDTAHRADVVYGYANVKWQQLIPITPSGGNKLGAKKAKSAVEDDEDDDLTVSATVIVCEEGLVLLVRALAILTTLFNNASKWWKTKNRAELRGGVLPRSSDSDKAVSDKGIPSITYTISIIQWARSKYNECLEKSEYVSLRLAAAQKELPEFHPGHPSKHPSQSGSGTPGVGSEIQLTSGITVEKLMYDRAVELSKGAALNELTNDDLPGCEIAYFTAIHLFQAILENDEDNLPKDHDSIKRVKDAASGDAVNDIEEADRETLKKLLDGNKIRLMTLRKKVAIRKAHADAAAVKEARRLSRGFSSAGVPQVTNNTPPKGTPPRSEPPQAFGSLPR